MILEALFNGELYPSENVVPKSDKFRQAGAEISDTMRFFEEKLMDRNADEGNMTNEEQFKYGFTLGVLMMCEIFHSPFFPKTE